MPSQKKYPVTLAAEDREALERVTRTGVHPASVIRRVISGAALVGRVSPIRCVDVSKRRQTIPGASWRLPARIENCKVVMSLLEPIERGLAALTCRRQAEKEAEQLLGATPVGTPA